MVFLILNPRDRRPVWQQIKEELGRLVLVGAVRPGEVLPGARELSAKLAINPRTVQQAYQALEEEGYVIVSQDGAPMVLDIRSSGAKKKNLLRLLDSAAEELIWLGMTAEQLSQRMLTVRERGAGND